VADRPLTEAEPVDELERIRAEYRRRDREIAQGFYATERPANLFIRHGQERGIVELLHTHGVTPLRDRRLLDIGCGNGQWLAAFEGFGMRRGDLAGIDLDDARIQECRERLPGVDARAGNAAQLPWPDGSFDLVSQLTVFTSILDARLRRDIAAEMLRVLRPGGSVIWYDFVFDNPRNPQVRGVRRREIAALFPGCRLDLRRSTLAPPIVRRLVPISWSAASLLERLQILNTHCVGLITRS
jgi:SAM-dependent methyltransferase